MTNEYYKQYMLEPISTGTSSMTLEQILNLLKQTCKRLSKEEQRLLRKRNRNNEWTQSLKEVQDELSALYQVQYYIKQMRSTTEITPIKEM